MPFSSHHLSPKPSVFLALLAIFAPPLELNPSLNFQASASHSIFLFPSTHPSSPQPSSGSKNNFSPFPFLPCTNKSSSCALPPPWLSFLRVLACAPHAPALTISRSTVLINNHSLTSVAEHYNTHQCLATSLTVPRIKILLVIFLLLPILCSTPNTFPDVPIINDL